MAQNNTITYPSVNNVDRVGGKGTYRFSSHTDSMRHLLTLIRKAPVVQGASKGVRHSTIRITKDLSVESTEVGVDIVKPYTLELSFHVPVGATDAEINAEIINLVNFIIQDDVSASGVATSYAPLTDSQQLHNLLQYGDI